ncbi:MAG: glycosyltransferase [Bacteroidetes bacterium]|nr:glycosyltransferase [Bacteroidota bacterium]
MNLLLWFLILPALGYFGLFCVAGRIWLRWKPSAVKTQNYPGLNIAVIAAFRNEEAHLPALLQWWYQLNTQGYKVEFILADDHSGDGSVQIVRAFQQKHPEFPLLLIQPEPAKQGKKAALSAAINSSNAELCLLTDADCHGGEDWLQLMVATFIQEERKMLSGPVCLEQGSSFLRRFQSLEHAGLVAFGAVSMHLGKPTMCNGASLLFYRSVWQELGGYEAHSHLPGGDDELFMRAVDKAYPGSVGFCKLPEAIVYTAAAPNVSVFFKQRLRWASKGSMQGIAVRLFRSLLVLWYALLLSVLPLLFFVEDPLLAAIFTAWTLKLCGEWYYFRSITPFFSIRTRFPELCSFQGFQAAYPVLIALARLFRLRFGWKERQYR